MTGEAQCTTSRAPRAGAEMAVTDNTAAGARFGGRVTPSWENTMSLFDVVVAAIVSIGPRLSGEQIDRYAADIAYVAKDDLDLALALVVVQDAESTWRESVETCKVTGDGGLAISSFQLHKYWRVGFSPAEICRSHLVATALAARALMVLARYAGIENAFRLYVGCRVHDVRAVRRRMMFQRLRALPAARAYALEMRHAA